MNYVLSSNIYAEQQNVNKWWQYHKIWIHSQKLWITKCIEYGILLNNIIISQTHYTTCENGEKQNYSKWFILFVSHIICTLHVLLNLIMSLCYFGRLRNYGNNMIIIIPTYIWTKRRPKNLLRPILCMHFTSTSVESTSITHPGYGSPPYNTTHLFKRISGDK